MKQNEHRVVGSGAGKASASLCCPQKTSMMIPFFCWLPQINTQSLHCILPTDACALLFYSNHRCYGRSHLGHLRPWKPYNKRWKNPRFWSTPVKDIPGKQLKFKSLNSYSEPFPCDQRMFASLHFWKKSWSWSEWKYRAQEANIVCWSMVCHEHVANKIIFLVIRFFSSEARTCNVSCV